MPTGPVTYPFPTPVCRPDRETGASFTQTDPPVPLHAGGLGSWRPRLLSVLGGFFYLFIIFGFEIGSRSVAQPGLPQSPK